MILLAYGLGCLNFIAILCAAVSLRRIRQLTGERDTARSARDMGERVIAALEANLKDAHRRHGDLARAFSREVWLRETLTREVEARGIRVNITRYSDLAEFTREDTAPIVERGS